jgi:protein-tyrosine phosphatase
MSRKLRAVCNDRKVWEEIFFRRVLGKEREMKEAKRNGTLPELLAQLRTTELYGIWKALGRDNDQFVNLLAVILVQELFTPDTIYFVNVDIYLLAMAQRGMVTFISTNQTVIDLIRTYYKMALDPPSIGVIQTAFDKRIYHLIAYLLSNGWNAQLEDVEKKFFDNKPLLCSICSASPSAFACALCETRAYCSHACAALDPIGNHTHAEHDMDLVLPPHIYIGSLAAAQRLPAHIGAVLSVLSRVDKPKIQDRAHLYVELDDDPEAPIEEYWDDMADFIYKQADIKGRDILVHCHAGMSRSVSAVIYYMIKYRGYTDADAALEMIQRARPVAGPNEGFMDKLRVAAARRAAAGSKFKLK